MRPQAVDTVFLQAPRDAASLAADWALVVLAAALVVATLSLIILVVRSGNAVRRVGRVAEKKADPLLERGRSVAANLEFITATLRTDMEGLHRSVRALSDRLQQASDHMETRIEEFNALMEVVQGEAEDVFLDTASTARGVRAGARRLVESSRRAAGELAASDPVPLPDGTAPTPD